MYPLRRGDFLVDKGVSSNTGSVNARSTFFAYDEMVTIELYFVECCLCLLLSRRKGVNWRRRHTSRACACREC